MNKPKQRANKIGRMEVIAKEFAGADGQRMCISGKAWMDLLLRCRKS